MLPSLLTVSVAAQKKWIEKKIDLKLSPLKFKYPKIKLS